MQNDKEDEVLLVGFQILQIYFIGRDPRGSRPFILWLDVFTLWYEQLSVRLIESSRWLQYLIIFWALINFTISPILDLLTKTPYL